MILKRITQKNILLALLIVAVVFVLVVIVYFCIKFSSSFNSNIIDNDVSASSTKYIQTIDSTGVTFHIAVPVSYGFDLRVVREDSNNDSSTLGGVSFIPALSGDVDWPVTISASVKSVEKDKNLHQIIDEGLLYPQFGVQDSSTGSYITCSNKEFFVHKEVVSPQRTIHRAVLKYNDKVVLIAMMAFDTREHHHVFEDQESFFKDVLCEIVLE